METLKCLDRVGVDEWHSSRTKMSSKVGMAEPVRICSQMLSMFNKSKDHKDLIHVGQVGLGISSFR